MIPEDLELVPLSAPERRRAPRPTPPPPGMAPRLRSTVDQLADFIESGWKGWAAYFAFCALCVAFIVWNLTARFASLDETYALVGERAALDRQFEELTEHYSRDELQQLLDQISSAESSIFADYASLAAWLAAETLAARDLQLNLTYVMHDTVAAQIKDVGEVPITLSLRPIAGFETGTYQRMLAFLRAMVGTRWHLEITDAAIQSDGAAVVNLETTIHVWVDALQVAGG
ncbi:MAG: hypothetical protein AAGE43_14710 [Pseudomonadota bacterium]